MASARLNSDYYDVDALLAQEEKVPTVFNINATGLGFLDPSSGKDVKQDTKVTLPYWLADKLAKSKVIRVELPASHSASQRAHLQADAAIVSFQRSPFFYELGVKLAVLLNDGALVAAILDAMKKRFKSILDKSQNWREEDYTPFTVTLSSFEKKLFLAGYKTMRDFERWKNRKAHTLKASGLIRTKRKRDNFQAN